MYFHLNRLALVTATLVLPLIVPLKLTSIPLAVRAASAQTPTTQDRKVEALKLYQAGIEQYNEGRFQQALETFERVLDLVRAVNFRQGEGATLNYIGIVYASQSQYSQALKFFEQA